MDPRITAYLAQQGLASDVQGVVPLAGDASDRRYFRVSASKGGGSCVLALHAGPIDVDTLPFVSVARLMRAIPLPVPSVLHFSNELGVLGLDDLGDVTLQAHLGAASPAEHAALYRQAVAFIATMQQRGAALASAEYPAYAHCASTSRSSTWELEFFVKHYLRRLPRRCARRRDPRRVARGVGRHRRGTGGGAAGAVPPRLPQPQPDAARRIAVHHRFPGRPHGPRRPTTWRRCSAIPMSTCRHFRSTSLISYFRSLTRGAQAARADDDVEFRRRFDLMALQRNLKALGTFGYQTTARGNTVYMQYIPRTLSYVKANLAPYRRFDRLRELLAATVAELR